MKLANDIVEALKQLSKTDKGITVISSKHVKKFISYRELWNRSCYFAEKLGNSGVRAQHEVIIKCENVELFLYAFWACAIGSYIAIPLDATNNGANNELLSDVLIKSDNPIIVNDVEIQNQSNVSVINIKNMYQEILACGNYTDREYHTNLDDILYVLYSSGTTGTPKGVIITKANVAANSEGFIKQYDINDQDRFLSWQPLTHCYCLVTLHLTPLLAGAEQCFISSKLYMNQPMIWMDMIHEYKATRIASVPFALKHFCSMYNKSEKKFSWDISRVKSMFLGGEQINYALYKEFCDAVEQYGFSIDSVSPLYGLTEATVMVTTNPIGKKARKFHIINKKLMVGDLVTGEYVEDAKDMDNVFLEMGTALETVDISIRDDNFNELPENYLGQICVSGPCVTSGYYKDPEAGQKVIKDGKWLCTGDVGFIKEENLFIIGREKELVVANGLKISCALIEDMIQKNLSNEKYQQCVVCNGIAHSNENEKVIVFIKTDIDIHNDVERKDFLDFKNGLETTIFEKIGLTISEVVPVKDIPKTSSGKVFRRGLTEKYNAGEYEEILNILNEKKVISTNKSHTLKMIEIKITAFIKEHFHIAVSDYHMPFSDYGIVSINIPVFIQKLNDEFKIDLGVSDFFKYFTVTRLADYIHSVSNAVPDNNNFVNKDAETETDQIAIIGMSSRFPGGANSIDEYWELLVSGKDGICDIPEERWELEKYYDEDVNSPGKSYCKKGGFLDYSIADFDARFFNISPKEAVALDPQQRLLLELTWEAFENANLDITQYNGSDTGVYVGISISEYFMGQLYSGDLSRIDAYSLTGGCFSTACGRISYTYGFQGPCLSVDTACSSSLHALHLASAALLAKEADLQVVAGVNMIETPTTGIGFSKLKATSADGHSKSFDASANGYGRGEGGGVILLKRLSDAIRDNNEILGVVRSTGINQDGKSNGLTAPNGEAQEKLIRKALRKAKLNPLDIDYVEMHGTGTNLGDPIEVNAVAAVYGAGRTDDNPLKIGSVKSNIGHLESAAGVASIIKVLLSMEKELIPANLHFHTPNPFIDWKNVKTRVIDKPTAWKREGKIRRAGINGFGFGGSNAHVIIEEYRRQPEVQNEEQSRNGIDYILKISAKSEYSLNSLVQEYCSLLKNCDDSKLADVIYTANTDRADLEYRFAVCGNSKKQIVNRMDNYLQEGSSDGVIVNTHTPHLMQKGRKVVFMFTGQGSQYVNMGKLLYDTNESFRTAFDHCDKLFKPYLLASIVDLVYGGNTDGEVIGKTIYAQPLIFAVEYALFQMWKSYGVAPEIVMGHSIGEYAAAVAANMIDLKDAVKLVAVRGRLMDMAPGKGKMATIFAEREKVQELLTGYEQTACIAARNAKETCVISGCAEDVDQIIAKAVKEEISVKELKVSHAFHSMMMDPILEDFRLIAEDISYKIPEVRFISALYGKELEENQILDSGYWVRHIREQVDFYQAITSIDKKENYLMLEVGSNRVLAALCKLIFEDECTIAASLNIKREDHIQLAEELAYTYVAGVDLDWKQVIFAGKVQWNKVKLPNYKYEKSKYWTELLYDRQSTVISQEDYHQILGQRIDLSHLDNSTIYQSKFTATEPYFMKEHIIFETAISPAAAHLSMMLSAIKDTEKEKSCTLSNIELRAPLAAKDDEQRLVQICIGKEEGASKFKIISRDFNTPNDKWLLHAKGDLKIHTNFSNTEMKADIEAYKELNYRTDMEESGVYDAMAKSGFELGEGFRRIKRVHYREEDCICVLEPLKTVPHYNAYELYPGMIDSIIQTGIAFTLEKKMYNQGKGTIIPYYLEKFTYNFRESEELWCHTKAVLKDDIIYVNVVVYNEHGEVIVSIDNLMAKLTNRDSLLKEVKNLGKLYFHTDWMPADENREMHDIQKEQVYLMISNDGGVSGFYAERMKKQGAVVISVTTGNEFRREDHLNYMIDQAQKEDWIKLLSTIFSDTGSKCLNIVYCFMEEIVENKKLQINKAPVKSLLYLVQAMTEQGFARKSKLKIMSNYVHQIGDARQLNLSASMIWGLAKVISIEYSGMFGGIVDGDNDFFISDELVKEALLSDGQEICYRKGKRYAARVVSHNEHLNRREERKKKIILKDNASYLITGGTGAVGLAYAEQLAAEGVKYLILLCRKEPSANAAKQIRQLEQQGVKICVVFADVCEPENLKKALNDLKETMPVIRGIVHAAGVLNDKMLISSDWNDFEMVLKPKVSGTINLYRAMEVEHLDFFMMTSSISSVIGNMGQGSYAAANYFMNCFAYYLEMENLPGFTFCWGAWGSEGMATGNDIVLSRFEKMGTKPFTKEQGKKIIEDFIDQPYTNLVIVEGKWDKLTDYYKDGAGKKAFLSHLVTGEDKQNAESQPAKEQIVLETLKNLSKEEREIFLTEELQKICAKIMGFEKADLLSVDEVLREQGADSLMIFSMRAAINKLLNVEINISAFFNYPTILKLVEYLLTEVLGLADQNTGEAAATVEEMDAVEDILSEIAALTEG